LNLESFGAQSNQGNDQGQGANEWQSPTRLAINSWGYDICCQETTFGSILRQVRWEALTDPWPWPFDPMDRSGLGDEMYSKEDSEVGSERCLRRRTRVARLIVRLAMEGQSYDGCQQGSICSAVLGPSTTRR
jgi:hypothetical protein